MHGGAKDSGAPSGSRNGRYRTGQYTQEMRELRQMVAQLLKRTAELTRDANPCRFTSCLMLL
jgi:hypothetical protein